MTEDDRSSAASNPKRSRSLRRRLRLLQSVLPEVLAAADAHASIGGTGRDQQFWGKLLHPYEDIELEQRCFDLLHDAHGDLVEGVLKGLEEVVQVADLIPEEYKQTLFPRLEILTEEIEKASDPSEIRIEISVPNNTDRIIELLSSLAAVIKDNSNESDDNALSKLRASNPQRGLPRKYRRSEIWRVSLQPFLITELFQSEGGHSMEATIASWEAKLLDHGILLMEIFNQEPFPSPAKQPGRAPPAKSDIAEACIKWLNSIKWGTFGKWGQAVEPCISGRLMDKFNSFLRLNSRAPDGPSGSQSSNPEGGLDKAFVRLFYKEILTPLEEMFAFEWPDKDPDEVISTMKLRYAAGIDEGRFFDSSECSDIKHIKNANKWFKCFDEIRYKLTLMAASERKIRIGVLDTGIDMNNITISQNRGRIRCWPPGADHHDNIGHGTHVAFLLLHLTKDVDLLICKITDSVDIKDASIKQIADPGKDRVDILNLSFGFPEYQDKLDPINKAIRNAASSGLIIFAAAGNEGGNAGMSWPASLQDKRDVIPIYSSNGKGKLSGMNPSSRTGSYIYTLGKGVKSCQVRDVDGVQQVIHRSGSSFATPIAAATAAIILRFVDSANPSPECSKKLEELKPRLRTRLGMERVMCEVCVREPKWLQPCYLTPWYLFELEEAIQIPVIIKILKQVTP
ncbi:Subtilisin-like protease 2 [Trichoderma lentiforme]|uniref:Subtilisin-like protease 2 n=1 Tax=Trichoderma lentiforme TaxID=1567552 RepID=A0A9P5CEM5_9HYPO|nr:Subtilisin-like protease 2 [Trichoderma lentiforme]